MLLDFNIEFSITMPLIIRSNQNIGKGTQSSETG